MQKIYNKEKGFTIVELMIVLTIIAVLAAVAVPNFLKAREKARNESAKETLKTIKTALEMYSSEHETYPKKITSAEELKKALGKEYWPNGISTGNRSGNLSDAATNSEGTKFTLVSVGQDLENCWQITEKSQITSKKGPKL